MEPWDVILSRFAEARILVVGDLILDQYIWGNVSRISPEAPIPVVEVARESMSLGGAANVAHNLRALGARAEVCGMIGTDAYGKVLLDTMGEKGILLHAVVEDPGRPTTRKTRIVAHKQQVVRVDREETQAAAPEILEQMRARILERLPEIDAVILEDYAKGVVQDDLLREIVPAARTAGKIVVVDPKEDIFEGYRGASAIKPNRAEAERAASMKITDSESLREAGERLLERVGCQMALITLGEQGMCLFRKGEALLEIPALAREVFDVSGAGDTVIAVFTTALVSGATPGQAAVMSNVAGSLVVEKLGTATVTRDEIARRLREDH